MKNSIISKFTEGLSTLRFPSSSPIKEFWYIHIRHKVSVLANHLPIIYLEPTSAASFDDIRVVF